METIWQSLSLHDIYAYLGATPLDMAAADDLAPGQQNPWLQWINDITLRLRAELRGNPINRVSAEASTLPPELIGCAAALVIELGAARSEDISLSPALLSTIREARSTLRRVAEGAFPISAPSLIEDPDTMQRSNRVEVTHHRGDRLTAHRLRGL